MRHETWLKVETSPFWHRLYLNYRILPDGIRAPLRWLFMTANAAGDDDEPAGDAW